MRVVPSLIRFQSGDRSCKAAELYQAHGIDGVRSGVIPLRHILPAATVLVLFLAHGQASAAESRFAAPQNLQQRSADLSRSYLRTWSSDTRGAILQVHRIYAPRVSFYGRSLTRRELTREKERFVRRWPARRYVHRPGTMRVSCSAAAQRCMVRSILDWRTADLDRRVVAAGSSTFEQGIGFPSRSSRPLVFYENGSVISRRAKAAGARRPA